MKWYKSYQKQGQECKRTGNRFTVQLPLVLSGTNQMFEVICCVPFKTFCNSIACLERRKREGKD